MPLTDEDVKHACPKDRPHKLTDGRGLYLLVNGAGKYWRLNYRFQGKQKTISLGIYPDISLAQARERCDEARKLLALGINPSDQRKEEKKEVAERAQHGLSPLRFDLSEQGALLIETPAARLRLTPAQTLALRVFLNATNPESIEGNPPC